MYATSPARCRAVGASSGEARSVGVSAASAGSLARGGGSSGGGDMGGSEPAAVGTRGLCHAPAPRPDGPISSPAVGGARDLDGLPFREAVGGIHDQGLVAVEAARDLELAAEVAAEGDLAVADGRAVDERHLWPIGADD